MQQRLHELLRGCGNGSHCAVVLSATELLIFLQRFACTQLHCCSENPVLYTEEKREQPGEAFMQSGKRLKISDATRPTRKVYLARLAEFLVHHGEDGPLEVGMPDCLTPIP